MKKKLKYLFSGYYGFQNTGDDAFCTVGSWGIDKYWGRGEYRFISSRTPELLVKGTPIFNEVFRKVPGNSRVYQPLKALLSILWADRIIFMGGSIFNRKPSDQNTIKKFMYILAQKRIKEFGAIGVSVGPFNTTIDYEWVRSFLNNFSFIALRDTESYQIVCEMGLKEKAVKAFDMAVLLPLLYRSNYIKSEDKSQSKKSNKVLGVSICHFERYIKNGNIETERCREARIIKTLEYLIKMENIKIKLFVFNANDEKGDKEITGEIYKKLNRIENSDIQVVPYNTNPVKTWGEFLNCDAFFGVRLHSGIFSYAAQIPFCLIEYHRKCTDFLNEIKYNSAYRIPSEMRDPVEVAEIVCKLLDGNIYYSMPLEKAQSLALNNFNKSPWYV